MKITVEHYDEKVSIERENDDLSFTEFMELVKKVAHGVGYAAGTVDEWFNQVSLRGKEKVSGEWTLVCLAYNLRRLHRMA